MMMQTMMIDGKPFVKTKEGYVQADIIDNSKPHSAQILIAGILALYAWLIGTVIYQIKYPQVGDVIGTFSYSLLVGTQALVGEAVLVALLASIVLSLFIVLVRIDAASRITKSFIFSGAIIWIFSAFSLLYGFETEPNANLQFQGTGIPHPETE